MSVRRVALLTAGGFAPCLSSAVGGLIERYTEIAPDVEIIAYEHGYYGLLRGDKIVIDAETRKKAGILPDDVFIFTHENDYSDWSVGQGRFAMALVQQPGEGAPAG